MFRALIFQMKTFVDFTVRCILRFGAAGHFCF
jgi:hypothetical protein